MTPGGWAKEAVILMVVICGAVAICGAAGIVLAGKAVRALATGGIAP